MPRLTISLLGPPKIILDGALIKARTDKAVALLAYLSLAEQECSREILATLLWSDASQPQAHHALRTTLWRLRSAGLSPWLEASHDTIAFIHRQDATVDVHEFQALLKRCTTHGHPASQVCPACLPILSTSAKLYRGDFLSGYNLPNAAEFEEWRLQHGNQLRASYLENLAHLVKGYILQGDTDQGLHFARRWVAADQFNEDAHGQLMRLYVSAGQRANAVSHYKAYARLLEKELGIHPSEEITALYQHFHGSKIVNPQPSHKLPQSIILVADIENAASMWLRYGDSMGQAVTSYSNAIKDCISRYGGRLIRQTTDQVTVLFDSGQPVHCAIAIQRSLSQVNWGKVEAPLVRMALHSVTAGKSSAGESSADIYRATQLLAAGWGGQILLTAPAMNLLELPVSARSRDLGVHTLRGLTEPVHVYELLHPHSPRRNFPPLQSLSGQIYHLPTQPTGFVGRQDEMHQIAEQLNQPECRWLSIVGPAGAGKTRLAIQAASQLIERFTDGVFFIPLAAVTDPAMILSATVEALKIGMFSIDDPANLLRQHLQYKHILLVVDNLEHLGQGIGGLASLLEFAPGLKFLATSRERLHLRSETVLLLGGMPYPEQPNEADYEQFSSIRLFVQNARRVLPGFSIRQADKPHLIRICQLVGGLPLGIELASAWVRAFSCQEIAAAIAANLSFLETSAADVPERHRSLHAAFDHSWNLLSEENRRMISRLATFRNRFTQTAALAVAYASPLDLAALADKSLLQPHPDGRYGMLATLRQYFEEKLSHNPSDMDATQSRYCAYYTEFLGQQMIAIAGPDYLTALENIHTELDNIRMAWEVAMDSEQWTVIFQVQEALFSFFEMSGRFREGKELFDEAVSLLRAQSESGTAFLRAKLLLWSAWFTFRLGDITRGMQGMQESLADFEQGKSDGETANALLLLADTNRRLDDQSLARQQIERSLRLLEADDRFGHHLAQGLYAHGLSIYGRILLSMKELDQARQALEQSRAIHQRVGTRFGMIYVFSALGQLAMLEEQFELAREHFQQALVIAREAGNQRSIATIYNDIGQLEERLGNNLSAIEYDQQAIQLAHNIGDRRFVALCLNNLAYHTLRAGQSHETVFRYYQESLGLFQEIGNLRGAAYTLYDLGLAYLHTGEITQAQRYCQEALRTAQGLSEPALMLHALHGLACVFAQSQDSQRAAALCALILAHPATSADTRQRASKLAVELEARLLPEDIVKARREGESADLEAVVAELCGVEEGRR